MYKGSEETENEFNLAAHETKSNKTLTEHNIGDGQNKAQGSKIS